MEKDEWCQTVLRSRMKEGNLSSVRIHSDVKDYRPADDLTLSVRALAAGFPCQACVAQGLSCSINFVNKCHHWHFVFLNKLLCGHANMRIVLLSGNQFCRPPAWVG